MKYFMFSVIFLCLYALPVAAEKAGHSDHSDHEGHSEQEDPADHAGHDHEQEGGAGDYIGVSMEIPKETQELIGLTTEKIEASLTAEKIPVNGRMAQDVENVIEVYAPEAGVVRKCHTPIGSLVTAGEVICVLQSASSGQLVEIKSPASGIMIADFENVGDTVDTVSPIHTIADLSRLSANFDIYENDLGKVKIAQKVLVYSTAYPDKPFEGTVVFISPRVDESSLTIKIRVQVDNPDYLLKPGMFIRGELLVDDQQAHFSVPSEAVQDLDGTDVVFVKDEDGSFIPTAVDVRSAGRKLSLVLGDLMAGDLVVANAAFILKSKIMESEIVGGCAHGH